VLALACVTDSVTPPIVKASASTNNRIDLIGTPVFPASTTLFTVRRSAAVRVGFAVEARLPVACQPGGGPQMNLGSAS
jgi:hypothetical protein